MGGFRLIRLIKICPYYSFDFLMFLEGNEWFKYAFFDFMPTDATTSPTATKILCRYYPHCKLPVGTCSFYHPPTPVCRFGAACLNRATTCAFAHSISPVGVVGIPRGTPEPLSKLKWVAPGRSAIGAKQKCRNCHRTPNSSSTCVG